MQIHELTQPRKPAQVNEGVADIARAASEKLSKAGYSAGGMKRGLAGIKSAWQQGKVATQSRKLADQSQDAWSRYVQNWEATMEPDEKAKFATRTGDGGLYKRQLTAWVQKNLLSGMTLANVTNRGEILSIIDQLSQARQIPAKPAAGEVAEAKKTPAGAVRDPVTGKASVVDPRLEKAYQAQQAAKSGPAAAAPAPAAPAAAAPAPAANATPPSTPGLTPSEESRLWLKLAQEIGRAQMAAYTGNRESDSATAPTQAQSPQGDPTPVLQQALGDQAKNIGAIGQITRTQAGTNQVKTTGNAVVDAALRLMGFTVS